MVLSREPAGPPSAAPPPSERLAWSVTFHQQKRFLAELMQLTLPACYSPNTSRRFALCASNVCRVGENPTCSVPALYRFEGLWSCDDDHSLPPALHDHLLATRSTILRCRPPPVALQTPFGKAKPRAGRATRSAMKPATAARQSQAEASTPSVRSRPPSGRAMRSATKFRAGACEAPTPAIESKVGTARIECLVRGERMGTDRRFSVFLRCCGFGASWLCWLWYTGSCSVNRSCV